MELNAIKGVLAELRLWVKAATEWSSANKKEEEAALDSLLCALNETMIYLGRINNSPESSYRKTEEEISRLWKNAALKVRPYNRELSKRCNAKGLYWGNSAYFTEQQISEMKISINDIREYANKAIQNV